MIVSLENIPISSIMVKEVKTSTHDETLQEACKVMSSHKIGSVIVTGGEGENPKIPIGIVTDSDVVGHIAADAQSVYSKLRDIMSRPLITVAPNTSLRDALRTLVSKNIRRLPVVENGVLVGIVTDRDIYRAIAKDESLIAGLLSDEVLLEHAKELERPWVYNLGEILHKRVSGTEGRNNFGQQ